MRRIDSGVLVLAAGAVAYDLACYFGTAHSVPVLAASLALTPLLLMLTGLAWRVRGATAAAAVAAIAVAAISLTWPALERNAPLLVLIQQIAMWGLLFVMFARTLCAHRVPLCTEWADRLHGPLTPAEQRYTRRVTLAWSLFFAGMGIAGVLLFLSAPLRVWAAFTNLWALPLVAAMFVGEYAVRHRVLRSTAHASLFAALRLYAARR
ncbi:MAG: hypothetical protein U1E63_13825 [Burkholderiales bacterium]